MVGSEDQMCCVCGAFHKDLTIGSVFGRDSDSDNCGFSGCLDETEHYPVGICRECMIVYDKEWNCMVNRDRRRKCVNRALHRIIKYSDESIDVKLNYYDHGIWKSVMCMGHMYTRRMNHTFGVLRLCHSCALERNIVW